MMTDEFDDLLFEQFRLIRQDISDARLVIHDEFDVMEHEESSLENFSGSPEIDALISADTEGWEILI